MIVVENLQRYHAIRFQDAMRPVHRRVPAVAEDRVDDVVLEPVDGGLHFLSLRLCHLGPSVPVLLVAAIVSCGVRLRRKCRVRVGAHWVGHGAGAGQGQPVSGRR